MRLCVPPCCPAKAGGGWVLLRLASDGLVSWRVDLLQESTLVIDSRVVEICFGFLVTFTSRDQDGGKFHLNKAENPDDRKLRGGKELDPAALHR